MWEWKKEKITIWFVFLLLGVLYVSQCWSPSSYAVALQHLEVENPGLILGKPRPIRSDEWAVVTPLIQAAVRNDFRRINETSYYKEDLRINYGLPIRDWGLVFKPTMWGYFIVDAARAYSLHWFAVFAMFMIGHAWLFRRLGLAATEAALLSCAIYFTGYTQFWWNEKGPIFAIFPWVVLALLVPIPWVVRLVLFYWLAVSWLVTNFYPPVFISLAFVAVLILLVAGRDWLRPGRLTTLLLTTACAGATAALYLKDYLLKTTSTIYPGLRIIDGGSVPAFEWWGQWFPFNGFDWQYESVMGQNICEVGVVGAAFALMYLCFLDHRKAWSILAESSPRRTTLLMLSGGLVLMYAWMLLPVPSWVGRILLWDHVQPERMEYAAGLLMLLVVALAGHWAGFVQTAPRMAIYLIAVIVGWVWFKGIDGGEFSAERLTARRSNDLLVLPVLLVGLIVGRRLRLQTATVLMGASALTGAIMLFGFNPIQSAKPIFARHDTTVVRSIEAERAPDGTLAMVGFPGAVLNGLGYTSVSHVTAVPALDLWRRRYPELPEAQFMGIFNRYSHIRLIDGDQPVSSQLDVVDVPLRDFFPHRIEVPALVKGDIAATWLPSGPHVTGRLDLSRTGMFDALQVLIGTSRNGADGRLHVRVCDPISGACVSGSRELRDAADNAYFALPLDRSMTLLTGSTTLDYTLWTEGAHVPVALLTSSIRGDTASSLRIDDVPNGRAVRFRVNLKQQTS